MPRAASASRSRRRWCRRRRAETGAGSRATCSKITADVTDAAGETRTGTRSLPIGRNPLSLRLDRPRCGRQSSTCPPSTLLSTNATGEPLPAAGTLRLLARRYRPNPPGVPGPAPETPTNEAAGRAGKHPGLRHQSRAPCWTCAAALAALPTGRYRLEALAARHRHGRPRSPRFHALRLAGRHRALRHARLVCGPGRYRGCPASHARYFAGQQRSRCPHPAGSGARRPTAAPGMADAERQRAAPPAHRKRAGPTALGPLYIHTTQVRDNRLYRHDATVQVAEQPQPLQPVHRHLPRQAPARARSETWRVTIHQANGKPADAELLATLYDQSLDIFRPHSFMGLDFGRRVLPGAVWLAGGVLGKVNSDRAVCDCE